MFRLYGIVGSIKGLGVLVSLNIGRLMATLEPRRRRMLAVSVLLQNIRVNMAQVGSRGKCARKANVGIGDLVREKKAMAVL